MVKPERLFTIRSDGSGVLELNIERKRLQNAANDLNFLMGVNPGKGKSEVILDCLQELTRLIRVDPGMGAFLGQDE